MKKVYDMTMGHVAKIDDFRDEICMRHKVQKRLSIENINALMGKETKASLPALPLEE